MMEHKIIYRREGKNRIKQSGNIFFMLFAAVAMVGAFGVGASNVMKGLVTSMSDVTRKTIAEERMTSAARISMQNAAEADMTGNGCDADGFIEPSVMRDPGGKPSPAGGGLLLEDIGAVTKDPWGTGYGYCAWDFGASQCATSTAPVVGSIGRLQGPTDPDKTVVAVISAGKDRKFSSTCTASSGTVAAADCSGLGSSHYNDSGSGHCYYVSSGTMNWTDAYSECSSNGGHLASITSSSETNIIKSNLTLPMAMWIGASDSATEGTWLWTGGEVAGQNFWQGDSSGSAVSGRYSNWNTGEPNNNNPMNENCAGTAYGDPDIKWNDLDCGDVINYLCEKAPLPPPNAITRDPGSDDIVMEFTYNDLQGLSGTDLWQVKDVDPDTATIDKNIEVTGGAEFTGAINLLQKGLILPNDTMLGHGGTTCTSAQQGELRLNTATSPISLEICDSLAWTTISMGAGGSGPADCTGLGSAYYNDDTTGHCYWRGPNSTNTDHDTAQAACAAEGGYLAVPNKPSDTAALENLMNGEFFWIGLINRNLATGDWEYEFGEQAGEKFWSGMDNGSAVNGNYANWYNPGEPMNTDGDEIYAMMNYYYAGTKWRDVSQNSVNWTMNYLCEKTGAPGAAAAKRGPVAHYKMDETSGTNVRDDTGTYNGTWVGSGSITGSIGRDGGAIEYDGSDGSGINLPNNIPVEQFTVSAWVRSDLAGSSSDFQTVLYDRNNNGGVGSFHMLFSHGYWNGKAGCDIQVPDTSASWASAQGPVLAAGAWYNLVCVYDGQNLKFYVDGALQFTEDVGGPFGKHDLDLSIGDNPIENWTNFAFDGLIDEVKVYDRALTDDQVEKLYRSTSEGASGGCTFSDLTPIASQDGPGHRMVVNGNRIWSVDHDNDRLVSYSLLDPAQPTEPTYLQDGTNLNEPEALVVNGNYAYVTTLNPYKLVVVNISNPASPVIVGSLQDSRLNNSTDIKMLDATHVVVAAQGDSRLTIVNVSNPAAPTIASSISNTQTNNITGIFVEGNYVYGAAPGSQTLAIFDVSNRNAPTMVGSVTGPLLTWATNVAVKDGYANVIHNQAEDRMTIVDVRDKANPAIVKGVSDARISYTQGAQIAGNYMIMAGGEGIFIWDISSPTSPKIVKDFANLNIHRFTIGVKDNFIYFFDTADSKLKVLDMGCNPSNGTIVDKQENFEPNPAVIIAANQYAGKIKTHSSNSCLIKPDNTAWCMGSDGNGQLGNGTVLTGAQQSPTRVLSTAVPESAFTQIAQTTANVCALDTAGLAWCWGQANTNNLGNGTVTPDQPNPVVTSGGHIFTQIDGGDAICGIRNDARLLCWGSDTNGLLGNGAGGTSSTPSLSPDVGPWVRVGVGEDFACGIKSDGSLWCWGAGGLGQMGNNTTTSTNQSPTIVAEPGPWVDVAPSANFGCALKLDGTIWCWGRNDSGVFVNGATGGTYSRPQKIADNGPWLRVYAPDSYSSTNAYACGIKMDGSAWCWGNNSSGQLGNDSIDNALSPVRVSDPGPWAELALSEAHACGIKVDGSFWCWGNDAQGRLGNGSGTGHVRVPTRVVDAPSVPPFVWNSAQTLLTAQGTSNIILKSGSAISFDGTSSSGISNGLRFDTGGRSVLRQSMTTTTNVSQFLPAGLIGYWPFDETSGTTAADLSTNANTGSLIGSASFVTGKYGNAVSLNGLTDYVEIGNPATVNNKIRSACVWIRPENTGTYASIIDKSNNSNTGFQLYTGNSTPGTLGSWVSGAWREKYNYVPYQTWSHVCSTWSGTSSVFGIKVYYNGAEISYDYYNGSASTTNSDAGISLRIGSQGSSVTYLFKGLIDEAMIFDRELTAAEVLDIYDFQGGSTRARGVDLRLETKSATASAQLSWKAASASTTRSLGLDYQTQNLEFFKNTASVNSWAHGVTPQMAIATNGRIGVNTGTPSAQLHINLGGLRIGNDAGACFPSRAGTLRYVGGATPYEYCNGSAWVSF
jgi:alpha-tubulin suppressor-like RCC1 family protein